MDKDKRRTNFRRLLSLLLCLMMLSAMPVSALADDTSDGTGIIDAQKLNEMTESFLSERGIDPVALSFCAGLAAFPLDGSDASTLLGNADRRLQEAKRAGRNRVIARDV